MIVENICEWERGWVKFFVLINDVFVYDVYGLVMLVIYSGLI